MIRLLAVALSLLLGSCGYHLAGQGGTPPGQVAQVYLHHVINLTSEPYVETTLDSAVSREFARSRGFSESASLQAADAELKIVIKKLQIQAVSYDRDDDIAELAAIMTIDALLTSREGQGPPWHRQLSWQTTYVASDNKMNQSDRKQQAVAEICQRIAEELLFQLQEAGR